MRELVEREFDGKRAPLPGSSPKPGTRGRTATINLAESPLTWLRSRGLVTARQFEAGERLRCDYERAALGPSVTVRWGAAPSARTRGAPLERDPTTAQIGAKQRFDGAIAAVGTGLSAVLWRVVCAGEGLGEAERALGWPTRSGKLVLSFALDRLADHYRLP